LCCTVDYLILMKRPCVIPPEDGIVLLRDSHEKKS